MKRAVFYGRYSSNNQTEQSIEGQLHVCENYAQQNDMEIIAHYVDRAKTGRNADCSEFQRMIEDSRKKSFEAVLVYKLDRFARNRFDSIHYKQILKNNGVKLISAMENLSDNPESIILESVLEGWNEYYSEDLSQKVNRGLAESFHKGYYMKKIPPFGYRIENRKLVPDETTAPLAKEIFERYNNGERIVDIVNWLNSIGMTNQKGNRWRSMNISTHLHNRTYMGEYYYGQFEEPMPCPALVSKELFNAVQEKLQESVKRSRKRSDYDFILTGKLVCAECGHSVSGSTANGVNHYYYCRHCEKKNRHCIPADYLHEKVFCALSAYLTEEKADQMAEAAYAVYKAEQKPDERQALQKELKSVEKQLQNAVNAILQGVDALTLKDTLKELEERRDKLRDAILEASAPVPELTKEHFVFMLHKIIEMQGREMIDTIVNRIILKRDGTVIICINLTDDDNFPPLEQVLFKVSQGEGRRFKSGSRNQIEKHHAKHREWR